MISVGSIYVNGRLCWKNPKKIRALILRMHHFPYSFCKSKCGEFSRQKTKYGAQNTHAPIFFFNTLLINWTFTVVFLYTGTLVNKVKWQVCLISFLLSFNKQQKFYIQSILFVLSSLQPQVNWLSTFRLIYEKVSTKIDVIYTKTFGGKIWTNLHRVFPCKFFWQKFEQRFLKKCPPKNN